MAQAPAEALRSTFRDYSPREKLDALKSVAAELPESEKKELAQTLLFGLPPGPKIRDTLYLMVIGTLLIILLGTAGVVTGIISSGADVDKVLGVFTTVLSFIIGLFVPSPGGRQQG